MIDYQAIAALAAVLETQSFQSAADKLFITQSAVSQRIRSLEKFHGEPILVRTLPLSPTRLGLKLLNHFKQVKLLEQDLSENLNNPQRAAHMSIAISRDSLETWFPHVITQLKNYPTIQLEIIADDQEVTLSYLQKGIVSACASTSAKPSTGCQSEFLGYFDYVLVASADFQKKYFKDKKNFKKNLLTAPAMRFDRNDDLHATYLKRYFKLSDAEINYDVIPSVAGFRQYALNGYAYALIPQIDIVQELKQGKLINLCPDKIWNMPVYWHYWSLETKYYKLFNQIVLKTARRILRQ